jgi:hypothetical protein
MVVWPLHVGVSNTASTAHDNLAKSTAWCHVTEPVHTGCRCCVPSAITGTEMILEASKPSDAAAARMPRTPSALKSMRSRTAWGEDLRAVSQEVNVPASTLAGRENAARTFWRH